MISFVPTNNTTITKDILNGDSLDTVDDLKPGEERLCQEGTHIGNWTVGDFPVTVLDKSSKKLNPGPSTLKHSAILFDDGSIFYKLTSLESMAYRLTLGNILCIPHQNSASYTVTISGHVDGLRENIFHQEYTSATGDISVNWKQNQATFTPRCQFTDVVIFIAGSGGCIISNVSLIQGSTPGWDVTLKKPTQLIINYDELKQQGEQKDDWIFYISDKAGAAPDNTVVNFKLNDYSWDLSPDNGYVIMPHKIWTDFSPSGSVILTITVTGAAKSNTFPVTLQKLDISERLVFSPEPGKIMAAPVEGVFNNGMGINVKIEQHVNGTWQPRPDGRIKAEFKSADNATPYFTDVTDKYHFSGQMQGSADVTLPVICAGLQPGSYSLQISVADNPDVSRTIMLNVQAISCFGRMAPIGDTDNVSRNWTTEEGRWYVEAKLANGNPAADQPVEFRISTTKPHSAVFKDSHGVQISGKTDHDGFAHIPAIVVPDEDSSFTVYVEAGDSSENRAQSHVVVSVITVSPVKKIIPVVWSEKMSTLKGQTFSVRLVDSFEHLVTSGKHAIFKITNNNAEAKFTNAIDTQTDIVSASLNQDGKALATCREITCSKIGNYNLSVIVMEDNAPFIIRNIEVTG